MREELIIIPILQMGNRGTESLNQSPELTEANT